MILMQAVERPKAAAQGNVLKIKVYDDGKRQATIIVEPQRKAQIIKEIGKAEYEYRLALLRKIIPDFMAAAKALLSGTARTALPEGNVNILLESRRSKMALKEAGIGESAMGWFTRTVWGDSMHFDLTAPWGGGEGWRAKRDDIFTIFTHEMAHWFVSGRVKYIHPWAVIGATLGEYAKACEILRDVAEKQYGDAKKMLYEHEAGRPKHTPDEVKRAQKMVQAFEELEKRKYYREGPHSPGRERRFAEVEWALEIFDKVKGYQEGFVFRVNLVEGCNQILTTMIEGDIIGRNPELLGVNPATGRQFDANDIKKNNDIKYYPDEQAMASLIGFWLGGKNDQIFRPWEGGVDNLIGEYISQTPFFQLQKKLCEKYGIKDGEFMEIMGSLGNVVAFLAGKEGKANLRKFVNSKEFFGDRAAVLRLIGLSPGSVD